jgi:hypothetical protein
LGIRTACCTGGRSWSWGAEGNDPAIRSLLRQAEEIRSKLPQIRNLVTTVGACSGERFPQIFANWCMVSDRAERNPLLIAAFQFGTLIACFWHVGSLRKLLHGLQPTAQFFCKVRDDFNQYCWASRTNWITNAIGVGNRLSACITTHSLPITAQFSFHLS